ncbi:hypothetical protein LRP49_04450 [Enterovibrio sp. ZSDZ35]|uniref:Uncharacterized protein n=1 Tax=Enterovibrio qingdaonensis TaxID=2899818 RepID=A0ABT5QHI9_9GAMM|nr:hypothetical protein [Enterovibrio sp. ZSDZ35]MDD1780445.1 hypothetical protein [Enterovibrio sp. ZSDZ35]
MNQDHTVEQANAQLDALVESVLSLNADLSNVEEMSKGVTQHKKSLQNCKSDADAICKAVINNTMPLATQNSMLGVESLLRNSDSLALGELQEQYELERNKFIQCAENLKDKHRAALESKKRVNETRDAIRRKTKELEDAAEQKENERIKLAAQRKKAFRNKMFFTLLFISAVAAFIGWQMR